MTLRFVTAILVSAASVIGGGACRAATPVRQEGGTMPAETQEAQLPIKGVRIVREDDSVWLDVVGFDAGEMCSSVHGVPARILEVLGESLTYEQLICYSGLAFRAQVHKVMCPSAAHPCWGFEHIENSCRAFPWRLWAYESFPWDKPKPADQRAAPRDLTVAALRQAVKMWGAEKCEDYIVGDSAYAYWLGWLRNVDAGREKDPKAGMQGNGWCYDTLVQYRRIAADWLKRVADDFEGGIHEQLLAASCEYEAIAELCMCGLECPWDLALRPDGFDEWTSALRQDQIRRLEAAREHDRAAIAAIEEVLRAL